MIQATSADSPPGLTIKNNYSATQSNPVNFWGWLWPWYWKLD